MLHTQQFLLNKKATSDAFEIQRRELYKLGVKTSYDEKRMIFSTLHTHKNQLNNIYVQECNGLILEKGTWRPIMVPPRSLRFNIDINVSNRFLHQGIYNIYKAEDGTVINLYYYDDKWCISTTRGYDMNKIKWDGLTYEELLDNCLSKYGLTFQTMVEKLDKYKCYTFGFKHPKFHYFNNNDTRIYKMWFIQSVDLNTEAQSYLWASDLSPILEIKSQELYTNKVDNLRELFKIAYDSLDSYLKNSNTEPCFGFILRSVNYETTKSHSDLFIESSLMKNIRQIWYDSELNDKCNTNKWCKEIAISLNAYLNNNIHEIFRLLFPQFQDKYELYGNTIQELVDLMTNMIKINDTTNDMQILDTKKLLNNTAKDVLNLFKLSKKYNLDNKTEEQNKRVLYEFITNEIVLNNLMPLFS